ncbi:hypothetical protein MTP99_010241 [Tenebrio molitor]|uniref:general odorant-binding protein 83a-like n=1 Tax=Tenebrio molitor TaxID=7067 RepID=UPI00270C14E6|nr:hypothetical protein MTP99_010241 [Tenebrio molitor]
MLRLIAVLILCALSGVLAGGGIPEEMQELVDTLHNTCVDETGVAEDVIGKAQKGDFVEDDKLKCYMKCIMEQMACIDDGGTVDVEATIAVLPEEYQAKADPIIRKCGTKIGVDACDNAFLTNKCWYEGDPDEYFLV